MAQSKVESPMMYVPTMDVFLNRWFTTYEDARAARETEGGYLFPYKRYFFVTDAAAIWELGLDPVDPDWKRIGWDWVRPLDSKAWERLREKREIAAWNRALQSNSVYVFAVLKRIDKSTACTCLVRLPIEI